MVGTLMSLRWRLLLRALRARPWLVAIYALLVPPVAGAVLGAAGGAWALSDRSPGDRGGVALVLATTLSLGVLFGIVLLGSQSAELDPARFQTLPVDARRLRPALLVGMLTSIGPALLLVLGLAQVVLWHDRPAAAGASVLGAVLSALSVSLAALALTSALAAALHGRRSRELVMAVLSFSGLAFALGPQLLGAALTGADGRLRPPPEAVSAALSWAPTGWGWALPLDVAQGRWGLAAARAALAVLLLLALWVAWGRALDHALTSPMVAGSGRGARRRSLGDAGPAGGPLRAVVTRELRCVAGDARRWTGIVLAAMFPVIFLFAGGPGSRSWVRALAMGAVVGAVNLAPVGMATLSHAGTATWLDLASGRGGRSERAGVAVALALMGAPLPLAMAAAVAGVAPEHAPAVLGMTLGTLGAALGAGVASSSFYVVRLPPPGSNPFRSNTGSTESLVVSLVVLGITAAAALPVVLLGVFGWHGGPLAWLALALGVAQAALLPVLGVKVAGARLDRRWPEILATLAG